MSYAILLGVSLEEVVVSLDGGKTSQIISHSQIECNKSAYWREVENRCATQIKGQKLGFHSIISEPSSIERKSTTFDKDFSILTETELQIELKNAISSENYELAEIIKKELERFK